MKSRGPQAGHPRSTAFLLAQLGAHAAARFAERLRDLDLTPAHAGALRAIATRPGISQQELATHLSFVPSRLVPMIDELEQRGFVERRDNPEDRRSYALHLASAGTKAMAEIGRIARAHDDAICGALNEHERRELGSLLTRIADANGLTPGVHPGFSRS